MSVCFLGLIAHIGAHGHGLFSPQYVQEIPTVDTPGVKLLSIALVQLNIASSTLKSDVIVLGLILVLLQVYLDFS